MSLKKPRDGLGCNDTIIASTRGHGGTFCVLTQDRWLESLVVVKDRMKKLESLRMDVDARRRRLRSQSPMCF